MPLPGDIVTITVTGTYLNASGNALIGSVAFVPTAELTDTTGHVILRATPIHAPLSSGSLSVVLPCTDNSTISPTSWAWTVTETLSDGPTGISARTYTVLLPHTLGASIDIGTLAPVNPPTPYSTIYGVLANPNTWSGVNTYTAAPVVPAASFPESAVAGLTTDLAAKLAAANNLSDLSNAATSRTNLGLGNSATRAVGTASGTVAAGDDSRLSDQRTPTDGSVTDAKVAAISENKITGLTADLAAKVATSTLGAASGVATLDSSGQVTVAQVPPVFLPPTRRLPDYPLPSLVVTQMQSGHGYTNNAGSTLTANDTSDFLLSTQSCKIATGGSGAVANLSKLAGTSMDTTGKSIRMRVKIDDITHLSGLNFFLGSSSLASFYKWQVQGGATGSNFIPSGGAAGAGKGWYTVTLAFGDSTVTGSPVRTAVTDVRWGVTDDNTGNTVTLHVQDLELIPDASATWPNGVISICFDDTYASVYTSALPKMAGYGYQGSVYTIASLVGGGGRMTEPQLTALQNEYGWESGSHAYLDADHTLTYTGMTAAQLDTDLRLMKGWTVTNAQRGMDGTAYPLGQYGLTTDSVSTTDIVARYFGYARTTTRKTHETFPPADPYRLRAQSAITTFAGGYAPSTLTGTDLPLIKANQLWGIYVFHNLVSGTPASSTECQISDFNAIIDAIAAAGIPVVPIGNVLRGLSTTPGPVTAQTAYGAAAATGTALTVSHSDHVHGTPALTTTAPATTLGIGTAAALGTATLPALADHVHPTASAANPTTSAVGDAAATGNAATPAASNHVHGRESFGNVTALTSFGTASANGSAATPARSDHVHGAPVTYLYDLPSQHGWLDWNFPSKQATSGKLLATSGAIYFLAFRPMASGTIANLTIGISTLGVGLSNSFIGLYSQNGATATLLSGSADQSTAWQSTGLKTAALGTSQAVTAGTTYLIGIVSTWATTAPTFFGTAAGNSIIFNAGQSAASPFEFGVFSSAQASLTSPVTMSSISGTSSALSIFAASS